MTPSPWSAEWKGGGGGHSSVQFRGVGKGCGLWPILLPWVLSLTFIFNAYLSLSPSICSQEVS